MNINEWQPIASCPKGSEHHWLYSVLDGTYIGHRGIGVNEWWILGGGKPWSTPSLWMPLIVPGGPA